MTVGRRCSAFDAFICSRVWKVTIEAVEINAVVLFIFLFTKKNEQNIKRYAGNRLVPLEKRSLKNTSIEEFFKTTHFLLEMRSSNKGSFIYFNKKYNEVLSTSNRIKYSVGQQNH